MDAHEKLTNAELEALGAQVAALHKEIAATWGATLEKLPINSRVRRQLANAGRGIQGAYLALRGEADDRNWSNAKMQEIFGSNTNCHFN